MLIDPAKLRAARRAAKLTQAQLAQKAGVGLAQWMISFLECGRQVSLSSAEWQALAQALDVDLRTLEKTEDSSVVPVLRVNPERLKRARKNLGITQPELATRSGLSQGFLSKLEAGKADISLEKIQTLATALGVSAKYLLDETEPPATESGDPLQQIREHQDIPPGLRELVTTECLLEILKIQASEWQVLLAIARQWPEASLTPRDGWVQILLTLRTASRR